MHYQNLSVDFLKQLKPLQFRWLRIRRQVQSTLV